MEATATRPSAGPSGARRHISMVHVSGTIAHVSSVVACLLCWQAGGFWLSVVPLLWCAIVWWNHAALARLHEAIHGTLFPARWLNEISGVAIGTVAGIPMSVYRHVHLQHHAWLGTPKDPELVPYSVPGSSRAYRVFLAWSELVLGAVVTPCLYTSRTLRASIRFRRRRRVRFALELALLGVFWIAVLAALWRSGHHLDFVVAWLIPAWMTGVLQTLRKFTEHLGLGGDSIMSRCRTIAYRGRFARWLSESQLHVEHHGTHHRYPSVAWDRLPTETDRLWSGAAPGSHYASHWPALREALGWLGDPMVGSALTGDTRAVG